MTPREVRVKFRYKLKNWSRRVRLRDGECVCCGGEAEQAHHIWPKVFFGYIAFALANGVALCDECHSQLPRARKKKNMPEHDYGKCYCGQKATRLVELGLGQLTWLEPLCADHTKTAMPKRKSKAKVKKAA